MYHLHFTLASFMLFLTALGALKTLPYDSPLHVFPPSTKIQGREANPKEFQSQVPPRPAELSQLLDS